MRRNPIRTLELSALISLRTEYQQNIPMQEQVIQKALVYKGTGTVFVCLAAWSLVGNQRMRISIGWLYIFFYKYQINMNYNYLRSSVNLFFLLCVMLQPNIALAAIRMGTRTLSVGETTHLEVANQYQTATGSWKTSSNVCRISARSTKSCEITALRAGKCTVTWTGVVDAGFYDDYYWDITVEGGSNPGGGGSSSDDTIYEQTVEGISMRFWISADRDFAIVSQKCISSANGRVTIPSYAKNYPVTHIYNAAFWDISGLTELVIPSTVTHVDGSFILGCDNLQSVVCEAATPPKAPTNDYLGIGSTPILYVPKGCKSLYRAANGWKRIPYIMEIGDEGKIALAVSHSGGKVEKGTKVYLHSNPSGANIYYTTDNSTPTKNSNKYSSTSGIVVNETTTLKVIAYKDGYIESDVLTVNYTIKKSVEINATNFPDTNFRNYLLRQSYGKDGIITDSEIDNITTFNDIIYEDEINLKGIEFFTALQELFLAWQSIGSLDISNNTKLTSLTCIHCGLSTLDVSQNTALVTLDCSANGGLTSLKISPNSSLKNLYCRGTGIKGSEMDELINSLPIRSSNDGSFYAVYDTESDMARVTKKQVAAAKARGWTVYCEDGNNNWIEYEGSDLVEIAIDATNFPDENFRKKLLEHPLVENGILSGIEIKQISFLNLSNSYIESLKGIEYFTSLKKLICSGNQLTSLDVSQNTELKHLRCNNNYIKGEAMDKLINSLPQNTTNEKYIFEVIFNDDGNICTTSQVAAVKAKGWTPCYAWGEEYPGSDPKTVYDLTGDGKVDEADIKFVISCIMWTQESSINKLKADINGDKRVDVTDIVEFVKIIKANK